MKFSSFSKVLVSWYKKSARDLPWRRGKDPYHIWVSEIMLQQTTVTAVIPYFKKWIERFPRVQDLALASQQEVLAQWQGLGYYARARNLHRAAQVISAEMNGQLPKDPEVVRRLAGFGPYTTGAVLSIAYDIKMPIIDANVRRVVMRLLAIHGLADVKQDKQVLGFLDKVLPNKNVGDFNQALMELGALVCRSKDPLCNQCPVAQFCKAYQEGCQEIIPTPKKSVIKDVYAVIAIIEYRKKFFIQKRPSKGLLADMWEFPGGKIEVGEFPEKALVREVKEELGVDVAQMNYLFDVKHFYTQFRVNLSVWRVVPVQLPKVDNNHCWVKSGQFAQYPMPSGSARIVERLLSKKTA